MKAFYFLSTILSFLVFSCNSGTNTDAHKAIFGIHEIVPGSELPDAIIDTLNTMMIQPETNLHAEVGYVEATDSLGLTFDLSAQQIKLVKTIYPVDREQRLYAVVAIKQQAVIDNSSIKNTKVNGQDVEIYFNQKGAKKWSDLTKKNIGRPVAFIIDNHIYSMPVINDEIKNGIAVIRGINNEAITKSISESLNVPN